MAENPLPYELSRTTRTRQTSGTWTDDDGATHTYEGTKEYELVKEVRELVCDVCGYDRHAFERRSDDDLVETTVCRGCQETTLQYVPLHKLVGQEEA